MPFTGSSRALGFCTRMRTLSRCEKMSALCISSATTESLGASNFGSMAQPPSNTAHAAPPSRRRADRRLSAAMLQCLRGDQHHALFGHEKPLGVLIAVMADSCVGRQLA